MEAELTKIMGSDTPLRLNVAAKIAFLRGGMSVSGLRREAKRGRLVIERVAGKDFTTLNHIERMRKLCRVEPSHQDSTCEESNETKAVESLTLPPGLSLMQVANSELAATLTTLTEQIRR